MADADAWWGTLSPERREQIHRWITQGAGGHGRPGEGQLPLLPEED